MRDEMYFSEWTDHKTRTVQYCTGRIAINGLVHKCMSYVSEHNGDGILWVSPDEKLPAWLAMA